MPKIKPQNSFVETWRACSFSEPPYIFPGDEALIEENSRFTATHKSFEDFIESSDFGQRDDRKLHLGLLPVPFRGNLEKASIFILLLNPGLNPTDYYAESNAESFRAALLRNLRQENGNDNYPFTSLDPQFSWQTKYWTQKLRGIIEVFMDEGMTYSEVLKLLARNIACIQFVPYHSKKFRLPSSVQRNLPSSQAAISYVQEVLVPRAKEGEILIIAARKVKVWDLPEHENIIAFDGIEAIAARLTPGSRAGKAMIERLKLLR